MQGFNAKHFSLCTLEMSDQEVIYLTPAFHQSPSEPQNSLRPRGTQSPGKTDGKGICFRHLDSPILMACQMLEA